MLLLNKESKENIVILNGDTRERERGGGRILQAKYDIIIIKIDSIAKFNVLNGYEIHFYATLFES